MPYRIYGGLRFFERSEIKDALAYLRVVTYQTDDTSFERIINKPTRGIGAKALDGIRVCAKENNSSLWEAACHLAKNDPTGKKFIKISHFISLINKMKRETEDLEIHDKIDHLINLSGLIELHQNEKGERGLTRIENLEELVSAAKSYEIDCSGCFFSACCTGSGRRTSKCMGRLCTADDHAFCKGFRVSTSLYVWHGRWPISSSKKYS